MTVDGAMVDIGDTALHVVERGSGPAVLVLHGAGLDHGSFGDYLDPLADSHRLLFIDQRGHGRSVSSAEDSWTLERLAADVGAVARALDLGEYAVLGHSLGAFVALQHAVDEPTADVASILCAAVPSVTYFAHADAALERFRPAELRDRVGAAMERSTQVRTPAEARDALDAQLPFLFADPADPRIAEYLERTKDTRYAPAVLRHFVANGYGGIDVRDRLDRVKGPMLLFAGRDDRVCSVAAAEAIAAGVPQAELVVCEHSGHFAFVEEREPFLAAVRRFLTRHFTDPS
ncbi:alpha/beta fold hydrolase [Streptomyces sp. NPDC055966]|uniref:alpha/beta fold hydrolase n=1 Tax=unclassified Streptomyces TaxID=2593676 RepID=UPI0035D6FAD0